jgi:hypothetical protein
MKGKGTCVILLLSFPSKYVSRFFHVPDLELDNGHSSTINTLVKPDNVLAFMVLTLISRLMVRNCLR